MKIITKQECLFSDDCYVSKTHYPVLRLVKVITYLQFTFEIAESRMIQAFHFVDILCFQISFLSDLNNIEIIHFIENQTPRSKVIRIKFGHIRFLFIGDGTKKPIPS